MAEDRRVRKTKKALLDAYVRLSKTSSPDKITVAKLCREADVSRHTFYTHYLDYSDFLSQTERDVLERIISTINEYDYDMDSAGMLKKHFDYIFENADLIYSLFDSQGERIMAQVCEALWQKAMPIWCQESTLPVEQLELLHTYTVYGWFSLLRKWWKSGFLVEKDTVRELFDNVAKYGLYNYIHTV